MEKTGVGWNTRQINSTDELSKYSWAQGYFHATHYNWDGKTWVRNFHELRTRDITLFALGDIKGKRVLDIGCGSGEYLLTMAKMGAMVAGQDLSETAIEKGREILKDEGLEGELKIGDATRLDFPDEYFDHVFSADFFEHITIEQKRKVIAEAYRVLKPGGQLTIKTPNLSYLKVVINLKRAFNLIRFKSPFIYIAHTKNNPDCEHHGLTTYEELEMLLEESFFHTPEITYIPLIRNGFPKILTKWLYGKKIFTEHIIISSKKSLFCGFYGSKVYWIL
jgi:ubiquinone/menaquinone biosynthesis C-methylase UbiE